jgi:flagellar motor protein MotB
MLVGVVFLFIILIMAYAFTYGAATDRLERTKETLEERVSLLEQRVRVRSALLQRLVEDLGRAGVTATADPDQGVLRFDESILFAPGQAEIRDARPIEVLARLLARELPCHGERPGGRTCPEASAPILEAVYVEGHTDERPTSRSSRFASNWELSSARAIATYRALVRQSPRLGAEKNASSGIPLLGLSAYAENRPVRERRNWDQNRRIDIRFLLAPPTERELRSAVHGADQTQ